jgi:hypothetical protein
MLLIAQEFGRGSAVGPGILCIFAIAVFLILAIAVLIGFVIGRKSRN